MACPCPCLPCRSRAAKMELWREDPEEVLSLELMNELALIRPPGFIYEARPPAGALGAWE